MKNKVSIIGIVGVPANYGGFESLVENLLPSKKIDTIYCSRSSYDNRIKSYRGSNLVYLPFDANGIQSILYDIASVIHTIIFTKNDLLILGVSGSIVLPLVKFFTKRKIITNIDGIEWKRDKWNKFAKRFLRLSEKIAVRYSDIIITDNKAIQEYVSNQYSMSTKVIAYGGDHAISEQSHFNKPESQYYLSICRIEPENNVQMILEVFSQLTEKIIFIGNWQNSEYGKDLFKIFSKFSNISMLDPIYDVKKLFTYRSGCIGYIHGHSAGGTNPSLVEMMHFSKPVIAYDVTFNRYTTEDSAFFFKNTTELINIIEGYDEKLWLESAQKLSTIARQRYTWSVIKREYEKVIDDL